MQAISSAFRLPPQRMLDVGVARLAYRSFGSGPDVLLIHGWPFNSATWRGVVERLQHRYRCHLIDLPGAGASPLPAGTKPNFELLTAAVVAAADQLGLTRFGLVGQDSGGLVARQAAVELGPRVAALTISGSEIPGDRQPIFRLYFAARWLPAALWRAAFSSPRLLRLRLALGSGFADPRHIDDEFFELVIKPTIASSAAIGAAVQLLRNFSFARVDALRQAHGRIHAPTQLLWGPDDLFFPAAAARPMAEQFAGPTRFDLLPRGSTFIHEEFPARYAELLSEHLDAHLGHGLVHGDDGQGDGQQAQAS